MLLLQMRPAQKTPALICERLRSNLLQYWQRVASRKSFRHAFTYAYDQHEQSDMFAIANPTQGVLHSDAPANVSIMFLVSIAPTSSRKTAQHT